MGAARLRGGISWRIGNGDAGLFGGNGHVFWMVEIPGVVEPIQVGIHQTGIKTESLGADGAGSGGWEVFEATGEEIKKVFGVGAGESGAIGAKADVELVGVFSDADGREGIGPDWGGTADASEGDVSSDPAVAFDWQSRLTAASDFADICQHECAGAGPERQEGANATGNVFQQSKDTKRDDAVSARSHGDGFLMNFPQQFVWFRTLTDTVCDKRVTHEVAGWQARVSRTSQADWYGDAEPIRRMAGTGR